MEEKREELFTKLGSKLTTAHSDWDTISGQLEEYQNEIKSIDDRYSNLPDGKRQGFDLSLANIIEVVTDSTSPVGVLNTRSDLKTAFENPLISSVQENYIKFYEEVGIEVSDEDRNEIRGKIRASAESNPEGALREINDVLGKIDDLNQYVIEALVDDLSENPTNVTSPADINSQIDKLHSRQKELDSIAEEFSERSWIPEEVEMINTSISLLNSETELEFVEYFELIDEEVQTIPEIVPLENAIQGELLNRRDEVFKRPSIVFTDIKNGVTSISKENDSLSHIQSLSTMIDFREKDVEFMNTVEEWRGSPPDDLDQLQDSVQYAVNQLSIWKDVVDERWSTKQPILSTYQDLLQEDPPDKVQSCMQTELPAEENLPRLYSALIQAESWISENEDQILEHISEDAQDLFHSLSESNMYSISESELDALAELMDIVDIKVVMDE
ncbi:hypothetical protein SAMN05192554_110125 [Haloarchaeobius iranensis]|uniref:Uncharacterized protein n=2 Tax=Haloarchaeobius iranensis TaxID=996166 RepID=A0A1G9XHJ2_9EURY|nr:hypothetical protein SAMN05192554_110125 [Haloarchaeobius iranensis]